MNKCSIKKERNVTGSRLVRGSREKGENIKTGYKNKLPTITSDVYCNSFLTGLTDTILPISKALSMW